MDRGFGHAGGHAAEEPATGGGWNLLKFACIAARPKTKTEDVSLTGKPKAIVPQKVPEGFSPNSPVVRFLMYPDQPDPGVPAPRSPAPYLTERYQAKSLAQIALEHEGVPEALAGPAAASAADMHLRDGWTQENLAKFRQNEVMCQHLFGKHWDPRYGRSRVRDHQTGGMLCWGDGETYLNMEVARSDGGAGGGVIDGHELRNTLRQDQRSLDAGGKPLPSERKGRVHLRGHPSGDVAHKTNDGYWRWLDPETAKGVDVKELKKLKK